MVLLLTVKKSFRSCEHRGWRLTFEKAHCRIDVTLDRSSVFPMEVFSSLSLFKENNRLWKTKVERVKSNTLCKIYTLTKAIN